MARRPGQLAHYGLYFCVLIFILITAPIRGVAAPYAALVMDARKIGRAHV